MAAFDPATLSEARGRLEDKVVLTPVDETKKLEELDVGREANMLGVEQGALSTNSPAPSRPPLAPCLLLTPPPSPSPCCHHLASRPGRARARLNTISAAKRRLPSRVNLKRGSKDELSHA